MDTPPMWTLLFYEISLPPWFIYCSKCNPFQSPIHSFDKVTIFIWGWPLMIWEGQRKLRKNRDPSPRKIPFPRKNLLYTITISSVVNRLMVDPFWMGQKVVTLPGPVCSLWHFWMLAHLSYGVWHFLTCDLCHWNLDGNGNESCELSQELSQEELKASFNVLYNTKFSRK